MDHDGTYEELVLALHWLDDAVDRADDGAEREIRKRARSQSHAAIRQRRHREKARNSA